MRLHLGANRYARRQRHELLAVGPREVRDGAKNPFLPEDLVGKARDIAHVNARAHHDAAAGRSEEHTSELQSPCNIVCRLLLEKKKRRIREISWAPLALWLRCASRVL